METPALALVRSETDAWALRDLRFALSHHAAGETTVGAISMCTLLVVMRGFTAEVVASTVYELHAGSAILFPTGSKRSASCLSEVELLAVEFLDGSHTSPTGVCVESTSRAWAHNLVREVRARQPGWVHAAYGLAFQALGHLERSRALAETRPAWIEHATRLAREQRSLRDIAALLDRHPSHVAREFRRHHGVSVGEYARRVRLEMAREALRFSDATIADIAAEFGFCDQSHLTTAFRRLFHTTPAEFRRMRGR